MAGTARSQSTDPFSLNKFHVADTEGFLNLATPAAGFNSVTSPEMSIEMTEYKEGINLFRKKFPGDPTFAPITLTKGVVKNDSSFYAWVRATAENRPYRTNLIIKHYHRDDVTGLVDYLTAAPYREYHLFNAISTRVKLAGDMDSMASDISIEEIDVEFEYVRLFMDGVEIAATEL
jgi:phage tail-like protein